MACGSSCCAPSAPNPSEQTAPVTQGPDGLLRQEREEKSDAVDEGGDEPVAISIDNRMGCCVEASANQDVVQPDCDNNDAESDNCCGPKTTEPSCTSNKGCCPALEPPGENDTPPPCCEGKAAPCCNESCLDRLALRECGKTISSDGTSTCSQAEDGKACVEHSLKVRRTYADRLEALGCICRALIALGQESCCVPQRRASVKSTRRGRKEPPPISRVSIDSCCAEGASCSTRRRPDSKRECCGAGREGIKLKAPNTGGCCADPCCAKKQTISPVKELFANTTQTVDLEKGLPAKKEHIILSISGMTCTGCETKLLRSLGAHSSVRNPKTSLILSRAEFDLVGAASANEVVKHLERTTEFKCEIVTNRGSNLDILADADAFVNQPWPDGVTEVRKIDKKTVNVCFNPEIIGARDLVERGWSNGPLRLAAPRPDPTLEASSKHVRHVGYMTMLSACFTIPVLVMAWAPLPERGLEYASASLALATLVQSVIAGPFYPKALKALVFSRVIEMDLLVVLSTSAAYIFSVVSFGFMVAGRPLSAGQFFETSTLLVTLIMVGRWASALARQKAVESVSVRSLQTTTAVLVNDEEEQEIDARLLQYEDIFKVAPDSRIPTDGTVVSGTSEVNESMITGESVPAEKHTTSPVIAGTINGSGVLVVRLTRLPDDNTISTIAGLVDQAKLSKPKIQDIADRVASYFVPVVIALTIVTFCVWIAIGITVRGQTGSEATIQAITYGITVLIVSCPCAIGLAVPMVIVMATGVAAERGVIFKSAEGIETACQTSHVVFDKTGTVTEGKLNVAREWYANADVNATKSLLLGLVGSIKHPVSAAVAAELKTQGISPAVVSNTKAVMGKGVEGVLEASGLELRAGNSRWLNQTSDPVVQSMVSQGYTTFCFTVGSSLAAVFGLEDSIRPDAASTIKTLTARRVSVHLISGDDEGAVRSVANRLNIPEANVRSRCTPADKQAYIRNLLEAPAQPTHIAGNSIKRKTGKSPVVMFCGDGTNDAVALAQATIGVHMNEGGTDVAQSAADVVLMRPNLAGILTAMAVSRKAIRRIAFNFGWSFVYNLFAILLAAGAFVHARIPPEFAGLGELVSVLPVIAAAALLRWSKI